MEVERSFLERQHLRTAVAISEWEYMHKEEIRSLWEEQYLRTAVAISEWEYMKGKEMTTIWKILRNNVQEKKKEEY
jgi:predicted Fe-S protein YdhL (DUF1289 family)